MKFLFAPTIDDNKILKELSDNSSLASYDELKDHKREIVTAYNAYHSAKGNVESITCINLPASLGKNLKNHYLNPPNILKDIFSTLRKSSPRVCPMCGSLGNGTLDHIFPSSSYSEFSIFTKNLVPACMCNSKRGNIYKGSAGKRILHPYYDKVLTQRLIKARITGHFPTPNIDIIVCYSKNKSRKIYKAISFHIQNVVKKTIILDWMADFWGYLLRTPESELREIEDVLQISSQKLKIILRKAVKRSDEEFGTPNNWKSVLLSGIIDSQRAVKFLSQHIAGLRDGSINPEDI